MNSNANNVLQQAMTQQGTPQPTPVPGESSGGNPLQDIVNAGNNMELHKSNPKLNLDPALLQELMMTGENKDGMFTPEEPEEGEGHEETDHQLKVTGSEKLLGKYSKDFAKDLVEHPEDYKVMTSRGEMTLKEAIAQGYDPSTKSFRKGKEKQEAKKRMFEGLDGRDKEGIRKMMNMNSIPAENPVVETPGIQPSLQQPQAVPEEMPSTNSEEPSPDMLASLLGGSQ